MSLRGRRYSARPDEEITPDLVASYQVMRVFDKFAGDGLLAEAIFPCGHGVELTLRRAEELGTAADPEFHETTARVLLAMSKPQLTTRGVVELEQMVRSAGDGAAKTVARLLLEGTLARHE